MFFFFFLFFFLSALNRESDTLSPNPLFCRKNNSIYNNNAREGKKLLIKVLHFFYVSEWNNVKHGNSEIDTLLDVLHVSVLQIQKCAVFVLHHLTLQH